MCLEFGVDEVRGNLLRRSAGEVALFAASHVRVDGVLMNFIEARQWLMGAGLGEFDIFGWRGEAQGVVRVWQQGAKGQDLVYKLRIIITVLDNSLPGMRQDCFVVGCKVVAIEEGKCDE